MIQGVHVCVNCKEKRLKKLQVGLLVGGMACTVGQCRRGDRDPTPGHGLVCFLHWEGDSVFIPLYICFFQASKCGVLFCNFSEICGPQLTDRYFILN